MTRGTRALGRAALLLALAGSPAGAADATAGRDKAMRCVGCHGAAGISGHPLWPNLAGQRPGYLRRQLQAFRAGDRVDPWMSPMAADLDDADIDDLAAYYAGLPD